MSDLDYLLSPHAIRDRAEAIYSLAESGKTSFSVHPERLAEVCDFVTKVTLENYPDLKIPFHSRWGHFQVGKVDRLKTLEARLAGLTPEERARSKLDLAVVSVLLDAGSGPDWKFTEPGTGVTYARSEGLAVASFHLFLSGAFSSDAKRPLQADSAGLAALSLETLAKGFQVGPSNPLLGMEGRLHLLRALGKAVSRPGEILDYCREKAQGGAIEAMELLRRVLTRLGPIWPGRLTLHGTNLGDVWHYAPLGAEGSTTAMVPFHKLSQWLTYSLIEPIEETGLRVTQVDRLTGLAEYRNGGLILDQGLVKLRDPSLAQKAHVPSSPLIIEWRALTVAFLDRIAQGVRRSLRKTETEFPLARVLEGGTWWAGRKIAAELRAGGEPPLRIESDGTVF